MEVHQHTHTPRKKWTHYFWEFLMLFLAVFCGFMAENQREHLVEHRREKQFMRTLIEDLRSDTAMIRETLVEIEDRLINVDSMLHLLTGNTVVEDAVRRSYIFSFPALNNLPVVFNDRTITQLKNAGNMRLIRNQKVNDGIIHYWNQIEVIKRAQERHLAYRTRGREMETEIFNLAEAYVITKGEISNRSIQPQLIIHDLIRFRQYGNVIASCGVMLNSLRIQIAEQNKMAIDLVELIKKEYHLK
jgi:hypothetical protein